MGQGDVGDTCGPLMVVESFRPCNEGFKRFFTKNLRKKGRLKDRPYSEELWILGVVWVFMGEGLGTRLLEEF